MSGREKRDWREEWREKARLRGTLHWIECYSDEEIGRSNEIDTLSIMSVQRITTTKQRMSKRRRGNE